MSLLQVSKGADKPNRLKPTSFLSKMHGSMAFLLRLLDQRCESCEELDQCQQDDVDSLCDVFIPLHCSSALGPCSIVLSK